MLTIIICALLGIGFGLVFDLVTGDLDRKGKLGLYVFLGVSYLFVGGIPAMMILSEAIPPESMEWVKISEHKLVSTRNNSEIHGSFFLGCGQINSESYYFYYKKLSDGGFRLGKVKANNSTKIYEAKNRKNGSLEVYRMSLKHDSSWRWFSFAPDRRLYEFTIPENSIQRGFSI